MKNFICLMSIFGTSLFGASIGNPAAPHGVKKGFFIPQKCWANIRLGYEGDFVFGSKMGQAGIGASDLDKYTLSLQGGSATLTLLERLDLYGVFSSANFLNKWRVSLNDQVKNVEMESKNAFLWSVGGRAILISLGRFDLGFGGRYSASRNALSSLAVDGIPAFLNGSRPRWRQWQLNTGLSCHIDLLTPYIGVYSLNTRQTLENISIPIQSDGLRANVFQNKVPVGLYVGCTLSNSSYFMLNVEGRAIGEEALTVSGEIRF